MSSKISPLYVKYFAPWYAPDVLRLSSGMNLSEYKRNQLLS